MIKETEEICKITTSPSPPTFALASVWKPKLHLIFYLIVFLSGIFFSFLFIVIQNRGPQPKQINLHHNLPEANYLQVRDEFPMVSPYAAPDDIAYEPSKKTKSKNTEGLCDAFVTFLWLLNILWIAADHQEALSSLKVALELRALGKGDKALRLFKHALALAPKNPEILTQFGEYLEHNRRDVVTADLMYFQVSAFAVETYFCAIENVFLLSLGVDR